MDKCDHDWKMTAFAKVFDNGTVIKEYTDYQCRKCPAGKCEYKVGGPK